MQVDHDSKPRATGLLGKVGARAGGSIRSLASPSHRPLPLPQPEWPAILIMGLIVSLLAYWSR